MNFSVVQRPFEKLIVKAIGRPTVSALCNQTDKKSFQTSYNSVKKLNEEVYTVNKPI